MTYEEVYATRMKALCRKEGKRAKLPDSKDWREIMPKGRPWSAERKKKVMGENIGKVRAAMEMGLCPTQIIKHTGLSKSPVYRIMGMIREGRA